MLLLITYLFKSHWNNSAKFDRERVSGFDLRALSLPPEQVRFFYFGVAQRGQGTLILLQEKPVPCKAIVLVLPKFILWQNQRTLSSACLYLEIEKRVGKVWELFCNEDKA